MRQHCLVQRDLGDASNAASPGKDVNKGPSGFPFPETTIIAIAVHVAYKDITEDFKYVNLQFWAQPLEMNKRHRFLTEKSLFTAIGWRIWVRQEDFVAGKSRMDQLWKEVFKKAKKEGAPGRMKMKMKG
ncbi:hypothetical protein EJ02DRAFT_469988 [Clathrospora elynae]|uniref:Uncharacterized protein n=1 Tax=Clathrospora elynae TaxID=706981 RepID=A0A6A5SBC3_9PLEO|nr:hypothetical protein EJ02DRAFT_469988 [Clathrospora elynae]